MKLLLSSLLLMLTIGSMNGMHESTANVNRRLSNPPKKEREGYLYIGINHDFIVKSYGYCNTQLPHIVTMPINKKFSKVISLTEESKKAFEEIFKQAKTNHNRIHALAYVSNEDLFHASVRYKREEQQFRIKIKRVKEK